MPESPIWKSSLLKRLGRTVQPRHYSLSRWLTTGAPLLVILTVIFAALPALAAILLQLNQQVESRLNDGLRATQALYEAERTRLESLLQTIANRPTLCTLALSGDEHALIPYMNQLRQVGPIDVLYLVTSAGVAAAGRDDLPVPQALRAGRQLPFSDFVRGSSFGKPELYLVAAREVDPIGDCASQGAGWVMAVQVVGREEMLALSRNTGLEQSLIVAGSRSASSLPLTAGWPVQYHNHDTSQRNLLSCCSQITSQGQVYYIGLAPLFNQEGGFIAYIEAVLPGNHLFRGARNAMLLLLGATLLVAISGAIGALYLTRRITQPLRALTQAAQGLRRGDLDRPMAITSEWAEIQELSEQLEASRRQLRQVLQASQRQTRQTLLQGLSEEIVSQEMRSAYLAQLAHEFRTPLASISATMELLSEEDAHFSSTELAELVNTIRLSAQHLQVLVDNLLESALIESGILRLHYHPLLARDVIRKSIEMLSPLIHRRQQQLVIEAPKEFITVLADPDRLCQTVINLLDNASKFSPFGAVIRLSVSRRDGSLEISVADAGPGFAPDTLEELRRPAPPEGTIQEVRLTSALGSSTHPRTGMGLGLRVVKGIVAAHGGQMGAENLPEGGARVWFTLPLKPETEDYHSDDLRRHLQEIF